MATSPKPHFPIAEFGDFLRSLWRIEAYDKVRRDTGEAVQNEDRHTVTVWDHLVAENPGWQLTVPGSSEALPRPQSFGTAQEVSDAITMHIRPTTAIVVQNAGSAASLVNAGLANDPRVGVAAFDVFLFVVHQDCPEIRMERYLNWFTSYNADFKPSRFVGPREADSILPQYVIETGMSGPNSVEFDSTDRGFLDAEKIASRGIRIEALLNCIE